ncbi:hypothetical protein SDRG_14807 [Saprolegnia diclina VS20]|uniref:EF-hand domain-containing protein n=1 Tax=Saprolegnia diclina (strain VS20) TaxID=1156394 RepID=T0Q1V5_SAPDV|nr:hypothetical protein SDRG_14807 [Saprolegnia diclina VS20]EQC27365.1 hypothetical protein SDRG_14807 [Saprolegnia diclina VS20]|eukprot:XP_008619184.1 hypothetical protein SDRG_14807 [Saprolegnia diclina VS20]
MNSRRLASPMVDPRPARVRSSSKERLEGVYPTTTQRRKHKPPVNVAEIRRKAALYNVGSAAQCPTTRRRKASQAPPPSPQPIGGRPPMAAVGFVHDLYSTVPSPRKPSNNNNHKHGSGDSDAMHPVGWRLGHSNSASSFKLAGAGTDGLLAPSDGSRQVLAVHGLTDEFKSLLLAYPPRKALDVAAELANPREWKKRIEGRPNVGHHNIDLPRAWHEEPHEEDADTKPAWVPPASPPKPHLFQNDMATSNQGPRPATPPPINAIPLRTPDVFPGVQPYTLPVQTTQSLLQPAQDAERVYLNLEAAHNAHKNPGRMYTLPIAKPGRACRLGLETLHSNVSSTLEKRKLRPKSALHAVQKAAPMVTVAGAKIRPKTARLSFLRSATVYCMDAAERNTVEEYSEKLQFEREKRRSVVGQKNAALGRNKTIVHRSIEFIFNCLRNQAYANVPGHLRQLYETLDLDDYMRLVQSAATDRRGRRMLLQAQKSSYDAGFDAETLPLLWLDRKQFTIALQQLKFSTADINLIFNAFDFDLEHKVEVGEVCREIRTLQLAKQKEIMPHLLLSGDKSRLRESF